MNKNLKCAKLSIRKWNNTRIINNHIAESLSCVRGIN